MRQVLVIGAMAGCAGVTPKAELRERVVSSFVEAAAKHDAAAIASRLGDSFTYAGLYFEDPSCAKEFSAPRTIPAAERDAFARCIAALPLVESKRTDPVFGIIVLEYAPGIELEVAFRFDDRPTVRWIGYAGRRDGESHPPTITPAWLEVHRIEGDPIAAPTADEAAELARARPPYARWDGAWMHVCIGPNGQVIGVSSLEISSVKAEAAFSAAIRKWKFKPIELGGHAAPVCTLLRFITPAIPTPKHELLPVALAPPDHAIRVPAPLIMAPEQMPPEAGFPTRQEAEFLKGQGTKEIRLGFRYCVDINGNTSDIVLLEPSGIPRIDRVHEDRIRQWKIKPYVVDGAPVKACSAFFFHYNMR